MSQFKLLKTVFASLLAAAALAAPIGKAHAAAFVGTFDPSFGGNLSNLGFRGHATFFIPDACLGSSALVSNSALCSGGNMSMTAATVELYRFDPNPLAPPPPTLAIASFAPPPQTLFDALLSYDSFTGVTSLLGVNTDIVGPQGVNVADLTGSIYTGDIWLQFFQPQFTDAVFAFGSELLAVAPPAPGQNAGAYLLACDPDPADEAAVCSRITSQVAGVSFTRVPEPATFVLVLAALAGSVWVRRRASQAG